jgi:hypothetical protein
MTMATQPRIPMASNASGKKGHAGVPFQPVSTNVYSTTPSPKSKTDTSGIKLTLPKQPKSA